nr:3-ketoacyl-CoA thiolase 2, peroxisomal [Tanacetum cinerariifolium]
MADCREWDEEAYKDTILENLESQSLTVFRTIFSPTNQNPEFIVTASSDGSKQMQGLVRIQIQIQAPKLKANNKNDKHETTDFTWQQPSFFDDLLDYKRGKRCKVATESGGGHQERKRLGICIFQPGSSSLVIGADLESITANFKAWDRLVYLRIMVQAQDFVLLMSITSENVAHRFGMTRRRNKTRLQKAAAATASEKFKDEIIPVHFTKEERDAKSLKKVEAVIKRERDLAYAYPDHVDPRGGGTVKKDGSLMSSPLSSSVPNYKSPTVSGIAKARLTTSSIPTDRVTPSTLGQEEDLSKSGRIDGATGGSVLGVLEEVIRVGQDNHAVAGGKLGPKWEGPYELTEALGNGAYKLRSVDGTILPRT